MFLHVLHARRVDLEILNAGHKPCPPRASRQCSLRLLIRSNIQSLINAWRHAEYAATGVAKEVWDGVLPAEQ